jgi:hypothetical protein
VHWSISSLTHLGGVSTLDTASRRRHRTQSGWRYISRNTRPKYPLRFPDFRSRFRPASPRACRREVASPAGGGPLSIHGSSQADPKTQRAPGREPSSTALTREMLGSRVVRGRSSVGRALDWQCGVAADGHCPQMPFSLLGVGAARDKTARITASVSF